jgi:hypothetical protein
MIFCVPSYNRAGKVSDFVINELPRYGVVYLFVRKKERMLYTYAYPNISIMSVGARCTNIANTRAWLCKDMDAAVWAMVDDDTTNFCAKTNTEQFGGVTNADTRNIRKYLRDIESELLYLCTANRVGVIGLPDRVTLARPHDDYSAAMPVRQFVFMTRAAAKAARYHAFIERYRLLPALDEAKGFGC